MSELLKTPKTPSLYVNRFYLLPAIKIVLSYECVIKYLTPTSLRYESSVKITSKSELVFFITFLSI